MENNQQRRPTAAFFGQAVASFGIALTAVTVGIVYLPVDPWIRGFLAIGTLYVVTSSFTLAKVIRDQQDSSSVVRRVDQARIDKLLTDHDPFKTPAH